MKLSSFKQMGIRLAQALNAARLSQEKLAERIGISPGHLSKLERGVAPISLTDLNRICEDLDVEADWIPFGQQAPATDDQLERLERLVRRAISEPFPSCWTPVSGWHKSKTKNNPVRNAPQRAEPHTRAIPPL